MANSQFQGHLSLNRPAKAQRQKVKDSYIRYHFKSKLHLNEFVNSANILSVVGISFIAPIFSPALLEKQQENRRKKKKKKKEGGYLGFVRDGHYKTRKEKTRERRRQLGTDKTRIIKRSMAERMQWQMLWFPIRILKPKPLTELFHSWGISCHEV